jgi:hypothetical protein
MTEWLDAWRNCARENEALIAAYTLHGVKGLYTNGDVIGVW